MAGLPRRNCVMAAVATPVTADFRPDAALLLDYSRRLLAEGCDGLALFGTTGEGVSFTTDDRRHTLERLLADGLDPARLILSAGALTLEDMASLAGHATAEGVAGVLLMPPVFYRSGIGEDGVLAFYSSVIERTRRADLRLHLYNFPAICGIAITPRLVTRLCERFPGLIVGVKDSGGDWAATASLLRECPGLSVYTGTEVHLPDALAAGGAGTICGLANVIPRLLRRMADSLDPEEQRRLVPPVQAVDDLLSRAPFIPSVKSVIAETLGRPEWRRTVPPLMQLPAAEAQRLADDYRRLAATLPS